MYSPFSYQDPNYTTIKLKMWILSTQKGMPTNDVALQCKIVNY